MMMNEALAGSAISQSVDTSPLRSTAEVLQMLRRDVKPGNGTSLLIHQNHASLRRQLKATKPAVEAWANDHYEREKHMASQRYAQNRNREMSELKKENHRLFGRLLNIYEVSLMRVVLKCLFLTEKTCTSVEPQSRLIIVDKKEIGECEDLP